MRPVASSILVERARLASARAWLTFVEIERVVAPGEFFRLVGDNRHRAAAGRVWQAAAIDLSVPAETLSGATAEASLAVSNVSRVPLAYAELGEFLGAAVRVFIQHENHLDSFGPGLAWSFTGLRWRATETAFVLDIGHPPALVRVPGPRFERRAGKFPQLLPSGRARA